MMWIQTIKGFFLALLALVVGTLLLFALTVVEKDIPILLERTISNVIPSFSSQETRPETSIPMADRQPSIFEGMEFSLTIESSWQEMPLKIHSKGILESSDTTRSLSIHTLSGQLDTFPFDLIEPITLAEQQGHWTTTPVHLKLGEGELSLAYTEESVQGSLKLEGFPLSSLPFELMSIPSLDGLVSLQATLTGPFSSPELALEVHASDVATSHDSFSKMGTTNIQLSLSIKNQRLAAKGRLLPSNHFPIEFDIASPITFHLTPLILNIPPEAPLTGSITAEFEVAPLLHSLLDAPTTFTGHAAASLQVSGTYAQPELTGGARLTNGAYEIPEIGVSLTALSANIEAHGTELKIDDLQAVDGKNGSVTGTGYYLIDPARKYPFSLELTLKEAALLNQDYVQIVCSGSLNFTGDLDKGKLEGELEGSTATITIPDRSYASRNIVDVTYVNIPQDIPSPQSLNIQKTLPWPLELNIHLQFPRSLSITGRDLTSTWKGQVDIQGTAREPLLFGELRVSEGEYLFNGNPFDISQGTITFAGDIDKKTTLYVIAGKDLDKVKVDVIAKGAIKNPEISFRSNPPLPQREILSWILFNRGTSEISPFQGAQLSESITNLSTNQQGPDALSKIRSMLGIDRFEICRNPNSNNNDVNIQIGKYISDNFLISVIKSDVNKVAIEATLTNTVKLQAQVGEDAQGQLLLKWKRDY